MNTLEEYLIKEGILEKFLENVDFNYAEMNIASAFTWSETEDGFSFWSRHFNREQGFIKRGEVIQLIEERIPRFRMDIK